MMIGRRKAGQEGERITSEERWGGWVLETDFFRSFSFRFSSVPVLRVCASIVQFPRTGIDGPGRYVRFFTTASSEHEHLPCA